MGRRQDAINKLFNMIPLRNRIATAICITIFCLSENQAMDPLRTPVLAVLLCPRGTIWHTRNFSSAAGPSFLKASAHTLGSSFTRCETESGFRHSSELNRTWCSCGHRAFYNSHPFFHIVILRPLDACVLCSLHCLPQVSHQDRPFPSKDPTS